MSDGISYYYEDRHRSWAIWRDRCRSKDGIVLIPKCASTYLRRIMQLEVCLNISVSNVWVPVRPVEPRFISGAIEFLCRAKNSSDPGNGSIGLDPEIFQALKLEGGASLSVSEIVDRFIFAIENIGFFDPHIYPQTYFLNKLKTHYAGNTCIFDFTNDNSMKTFRRNFGLTQQTPMNRRSKPSRLTFVDILGNRKFRFEKNARSHLFWGKSGISKRYGRFDLGRNKVAAFYDEFRNEVVSSKGFRSRLAKIYEDDFILLEQVKLHQ